MTEGVGFSDGLHLILLGAYIGGAAANNWQWNPLQWDWGNYQTYLGMAAGGLVGAGAGYVIGSLANTPRTDSASNTGVQTNPYNISANADSLSMQVGFGYDIWVAKTMDISTSLEATWSQDFEILLKVMKELNLLGDNETLDKISSFITSPSFFSETGLSFVEFTCLTNNFKHFESLVSFEGVNTFGKSIGISVNLVNGNLVAILPSNFSYQEVLFNYTQGYTKVVSFSTTIAGALSVNIVPIKSGSFYGCGFGGNLGYTTPSSLSFHNISNSPIAIRELEPWGIMSPPGWNPADHKWEYLK